MQQQVIDYLSNHWSADKALKIAFSPVPKGQAGDLAMQFFALTKELKQSPIEIGNQIAQILVAFPLVEKTEMSGPYLNLFFSQTAFFENVFQTPLTTHLFKGEKVVLEYSSPNTNKPLHLGHMRNHALGISVGNLLEAVGAEVIRTAIVNDRGIHICKSMLAYQRFGNGETPESPGEKPDQFVGRYYVKFGSEVKKDESLNQQAQALLRLWEEGDKATKALWQQMNEWTYAGHDATYARQGVVFDKKYFESQTYEQGRDFALKGLADGVFYKKDGAVWIDLTDQGLDEKIIIRSDGTTVYVTQDLATTYQRVQDFAFDQHIWVVADEQNYHFQVLIACLDKLGLADKEKLHHLNYGLVNLPEGRMKSREGTVVDADPLMDELQRLVALKMRETHKDDDLSDDEIETISDQVQNAAWKFYLLKTSPNKTITFETEKSIDFHGATGPYLQYAGVRIKSILAKAKVANLIPENTGALGEAEKALGVKILEWPGTLNRAAEMKNPTYIVTFLLELTQTWSSFYAENSVLKAETDDLKKARLALAAKVLEVLEAGLNILGIQVPERM
jgi:arginyl-tRNA synthetase